MFVIFGVNIRTTEATLILYILVSLQWKQQNGRSKIFWREDDTGATYLEVWNSVG